MSSKLTNCKACGAEIAASAKACPQCGAKVKKPIYKKWWLWLLVAIVVIIIACSGGSDSDSGKAEDTAAKTETTEQTETKEEEPITYTHYNVTELFDALESNAMKAQNDFEGQYVEIEGYLGTIDASGKYICVTADPDDYDYFLDDIHCDIKTDEQKTQVMELTSESPIVVRGKITSVGEVLGYSLDIDSIN